MDGQEAEQPQESRSGFRHSHDHAGCKAQLALRVIQGRWKLLILRELIDAVRRFSDLQRALPGVSQKVLSAQLRDLEADGVVRRTVYAQVPPRVDYAITPLGRELLPVLDELHAWGEKISPELPHAEAQPVVTSGQSG